MSNKTNDNMSIFNAVRSVPPEAQKPIKGGALGAAGMTDISPMWRIEKLTEVFGACGKGWNVEITSQRLEPAADGIYAFVDIQLFVKYEEGWSDAIPGIGGNFFVKGGRASDECFKMAFTDAISVACKLLGVGADIYAGKNETTKYSQPQTQAKPAQQSKPPAQQQTRQQQPKPQQQPKTRTDGQVPASEPQLKMIYRLAKSLESLGKPPAYVKDAMETMFGVSVSTDLSLEDAKALIEWGLGIESDLKAKVNLEPEPANQDPF